MFVTGVAKWCPRYAAVDSNAGAVWGRAIEPAARPQAIRNYD